MSVDTPVRDIEITYKNLHNRFKLNGIYYDLGELGQVACTYIKEGDAYQKAIGDFLLEWLDNSDVITVKTSGSTGTPKEIVLKKQNMVHSALATGNFFGVEVGNKALLCLPADYIAGKMMLVRAIILGLELDLVQPSASPLKATGKEYDFVAMTPMQVENSLDEIYRVKTLLAGGAPMSDKLKKALLQTGCNVFETYGMTETITHIAAKRIQVGGVEDEDPCFRVMPGVTVSLDERGCLVIHAPEITDETIVTNDLAELVSETAFKWLGRADHVINSGGIKLIPEQVEAKLEKLLEGRFYITGIPDDTLGEKLVLYVEKQTNTGWTPEGIREKIDHLEGLDKYENPKEIFMVEKFRETSSGKVLRNNHL
ncbi:AMP-binding protein [Sinomicrobium soli]|uniref:AMP-binding protein n=1 Tax=Sinomicrobium sp. N-1-3-6 TaxID=2219864 RepID=UPI000DCD0AF0|nr:AMP-binding protein [Sinomicrobium sp. N-1-3-6]RAV28688.1 O-succinylbenzoic acid--CoA ligase [Sinomicrobium sp. N-1-3-6]